MHSVLISACLLGENVRYDGRSIHCANKVLERWLAEGRLIPFCPEVAGGLPVPRPPAEIAPSTGGPGVIAHTTRVMDVGGHDVTDKFIKGAEQACALAGSKGVGVAVLKEGSPSCGSRRIYDGTFSGVKVPGCGVTTALLRMVGMAVFSESEFVEADRTVRQLEAAVTTPIGRITP